MKKSVIFGILGLGVGLTTSYGQGTVNFANYQNSTSLTVTYAATSVPAGKAGLTLGGSFAVELGFFNGITASTAALTMIPASLTYFGIDNGPGPNGDADGAAYTGWYQGSVINLASYGWAAGQAGQVVTLDVFAFNNGSLGAATVAGSSGLFQVNETSTAGYNLLPPVAMYGTPGGSFTVANVAPVPEPATMALGGLGLAALLVARRKKA